LQHSEGDYWRPYEAVAEPVGERSLAGLPLPGNSGGAGGAGGLGTIILNLYLRGTPGALGAAGYLADLFGDGSFSWAGRGARYASVAGGKKRAWQTFNQLRKELFANAQVEKKTTPGPIPDQVWVVRTADQTLRIRGPLNSKAVRQDPGRRASWTVDLVGFERPGDVNDNFKLFFRRK
jgi:hypothetical protein